MSYSITSMILICFTQLALAKEQFIISGDAEVVGKTNQVGYTQKGTISYDQGLIQSFTSEILSPKGKKLMNYELDFQPLATLPSSKYIVHETKFRTESKTFVKGSEVLVSGQRFINGKVLEKSGKASLTSVSPEGVTNKILKNWDKLIAGETLVYDLFGLQFVQKARHEVKRLKSENGVQLFTIAFFDNPTDQKPKTDVLAGFTDKDKHYVYYEGPSLIAINGAFPRVKIRYKYNKK